MILIHFCGVQGDHRPWRDARAEPLLVMARFYESRFGAAKSAQRAQICAPQGHSLGGRSPTFNGEIRSHLRVKPIERVCVLAHKNAPIRTPCAN